MIFVQLGFDVTGEVWVIDGLVSVGRIPLSRGVSKIAKSLLTLPSLYNKNKSA